MNTDDDSVDEVNGTITAMVMVGTGYDVGAAASASVAVNDNDVPDTTAPVFVSAAVNGNMLVLTYNEALDTASVPAGGNFTIGGVSGVTVSTVAVSGSMVTLTLSQAVTFADAVTVNYVVGANPLQDVAGNDAVALTDGPVTNNTPVPPTVSITAVNASVTEGMTATFTVAATTAPASNLMVNVSVTDSGSFISGTAPTTVTILVGSTSATLMVSTVDDGINETDGTITATVDPGPGYMVAASPGNSAEVAVSDDDTPGITVSPTSGLTTTEAGGTATFTVVLNTQPTAPVSIDVISSDEGEGTVSPMTLTFTASDWNRPQTVTVTGVEDDEDDGNQTYMVMLAAASSTDTDYNGVDPMDVSVTNREGPTPQEQAATLTSTLAGTGRLTAVAAVDVLSKRFQQRVPDTGGRRQSLTLAGNAVDLDDLRADGERQLAEALRDWRNVTLEDLMSNSAFELALSGDASGPGGEGGLILWGQGDWLDFDSKPQDTFSMDGNVLSGHVGVDYRLGEMLLGMALGHSSGEVDYVDSAGGRLRSGTVDSELLSLYPYVHYSPDGNGEDAAWAMVGFGWGDAEVKEAGQAPIETDIEMRMFGLGMRTGVYAEGDLELALKIDGFYAETESDAVRDLPSVDSDSVRGRLALELGHRLEQAVGALNSSLEVAARADAGDAEEGVGGEVGIGVGYTSLLGLDIEVRGRYLVAHSEEDFDEWGASMTVRYDTARANGQGFTFELAPGWGDASSRADSLWEDTYTLSGTAQPGARSLGPDHLDLQMGYGLGLRGRAGLLTPFSELSLAGQALRRARLGVRLDLPGGEAGADTPVQLELSGERVTSGSREADQRFELTATLRL